MGNGMNKVVDGLYLGNIRDAENREGLSKNGITHILSVYNNAKPVFEDMTYLCIHAADASSQNLGAYYWLVKVGALTDVGSWKGLQKSPSHYTIIVKLLADRLQHFKECITFIHECRLNGGSCLVHCLAGVSRSTTMVVAYLMTVTHYSWEECLSAVKAVRSFVGPNYGFQEQLQEYQTTQVSEYRAWLRSNFRHSPFNDEEQVGALLSQYTEQQESQRRGTDHRWIHRGVGFSALPSDSDDSEGNS